MSLYYKIKMIKKYGIRDGIIYIQIAPNGKKYIGQTINQKRRFKKYKSYEGNNQHHTRALRKYGYDAFTIQTFRVPEFLLDTVEKSLIKYYQTMDPANGYNKKEGGSNGRPTIETLEKMRVSQLGRTHTEEAKQKNRDAHLGKTHTEEAKQKIKIGHIGKTHSKETKKKIGEAQLGKPSKFLGGTHTEEAKTKIKNAMLGRTYTEETKKKLRAAHIGKIITEDTKEKMRAAKLLTHRNVYVFGIIYETSTIASNTLRFLYGLKSNFVRNWVVRKNHPDIFYVS